MVSLISLDCVSGFNNNKIINCSWCHYYKIVAKITFIVQIQSVIEVDTTMLPLNLSGLFSGASLKSFATLVEIIEKKV